MKSAAISLSDAELKEIEKAAGRDAQGGPLTLFPLRLCDRLFFGLRLGLWLWLSG
jgi:hypothetical protein